MKLNLPTVFVFLALIGVLELINPGLVQADNPPKINVWYGHHQVFGQPALPQRWINILGDVSNPNALASLTYSLNDGPERKLSIGPDKHRLTSPGDFNIDIFHSELQPGSNQVTIIATDQANQQTTETVTIDYSPATIEPQPYVVDWSQANTPQEVAQIVDGQWQLEADGIRPAVLGYDRLVAIGDMWWTDYELTVPITIHGAEPAFGYPSYGASVFIVTRWQGHRMWDDAQPAIGWWPLGGIGSIRWVAGDTDKKEVRLVGNKGLQMGIDPDDKFVKLNVPYKLKLRVETVPGYASLYSFKLWEADQPEPAEWKLKGQQPLWNPMYGSVLLVAHHVDATFGTVTVTPLARSPWEWFVLLGNYLAQLPILLICLVGIFVSMRYWRTLSRSAWLTLLAVILLAGASLGGTFFNVQLPIWLHRQGWSTHEIGLMLVGYETVKAVIVAIAVGLLLFAIFPIFTKKEAAN